MKNFEGYVSNGKFSVGCTGQTVYLYDKNNIEIAKFKDIIYAYTPMISPDGKIFVVKSTDGRIAVYSLETFSLIKKFRFSKVNGSQDDGFCFSPDGKLFFNIERHKDSLHSAISIYNTLDFSIFHQISLDEKMALSYIEFDSNTNSYYVLGFLRASDHVFRHGFVAKFEDYQVKNITPISEREYEFYLDYKYSEMKGFASKRAILSLVGCDYDKLKSMNHTLAKLFSYYNK